MGKGGAVVSSALLEVLTWSVEMALPKLNITEKTEEENLAGSFSEEADIHKELKVLVQLSEWKEVTLDCTSGETIFNIKKTLLDQHEVPFESTVFFNDKHVVDPLSLNDIEGFLENPVLRVEPPQAS